MSTLEPVFFRLTVGTHVVALGGDVGARQGRGSLVMEIIRRLQRVKRGA